MNNTDEHLMTVFTAALEFETAGERAAYLDRACAGAPGLRARVDSLLRAHERGGNFLGDPPGAPGATVTYWAHTAPGTSSAGAAFDEELRRLLRSRLLLVHLLVLGWMTLLVALTLAAPVRPDDPAMAHPGTSLWQMAPVITGCLIGGLVLGRSKAMSLRSLRAWELTGFATPTAAFAYDRFEALTRMGADVELLPAVALGFRGLYSLQAFVTLILAYGVLVPNTRRRSLLVVGALAVVPLALIPAAAVANPLLWTGHVTPLTVQCAFILLFPAAIAVFAASRASALQRRAFDAERRARQLGQYALRRKLGEGGMGEVWLADHGLLKRACAVKFIRPELAANPGTAERFVREVRAVTGLSHVNTVRVYDYGRADDGSFYLVMEYLDGPTLEELVRTSDPLPPGRVVHLIRQVCGALAEAHAAGLVHRDLTPGNVIVATLGGQRDVAKLLDFGLVHDLSADPDVRLTRAGTVLGTPAYMSPEQAAGESAVDARSDVYSLGAMAFFALTGRPPFQGKCFGQLLAAHRSELPPPVTELRLDAPADLAAIIARCLAKNPGDRFQSAAELERALAACESAHQR